MKIKAIVKNNILWLEGSFDLEQKELEIEVPDEMIRRKEETEGRKFLRSLWDTVGAWPDGPVNWKKEWQRHIEERYG